MKKLIAICAVAILFVTGYTKADSTWATIDIPGASFTEVKGIDDTGTNVAGVCIPKNGGFHGYLYNRTSQTCTILDYPGSSGGQILRSKGNNLVGIYYDSANNTHGFYYDGIQWATLDKPGATATYVTSINGSNLVGSYIDNSRNSHGFIYDLNNQTWTTLDVPGLGSTGLCDIQGNTIVGAAGGIGYLYNLTTQTWTSMPQTQGVYGINGTNIVGESRTGNGYIYNLITQEWTLLTAPGSSSTDAYDINGDYVIGTYYDASGYSHGFVYTIPEPATLLLLGIGGLVLKRKQ
jgi:hypothetical protein